MTSARTKYSGSKLVAKVMMRQRTFQRDPDHTDPSLNLPVIDHPGERKGDWGEHTDSKDTVGEQKGSVVKPESCFSGQLGEDKTAMGMIPGPLSTNTRIVGQLKERLKVTTEALGVLKQDKSTLESNIKRLCEEKNSLEQDNTRLKDNVKKLTEENSVLQDKLRVTQSDLKACSERIHEKEKMEGELKAETLRMQSEIGTMTSNLGALHKQMDELKFHVKETEKQHSDQVSLLKEENRRLSSLVRDLQKEKSDLQESVRKLKIEKETLMASADTHRLHKDRFQKAEAENGKLQKELESVKEEYCLHKGRFQKAETENRKLEKELESVREDYRREKLRVSEYKQQVSQINTAVDKLKSEKVTQQKELCQLRSNIIKSQDFSKALLERVTDYNSQVDKLLQHNNALLVALDKERSNTNGLQKRLQQCENDQKSAKQLLEARSQGDMTTEKHVHHKSILEENRKLRLLLMEKEFETTHLVSEREELKEKLQNHQATYEKNLTQSKELAKDTRLQPETAVSEPMNGLTLTSTSKCQIPSETERLPQNRKSFPAIRTETKSSDMHFSWTVNYSTRRKYLQQLRREKRL